MKKLVFLTLCVLVLATACKKEAVTPETTEPTTETKSPVTGLRSNEVFFDIPTQHLGDPTDPTTLIKGSKSIVFDGVSYDVAYKAVVTNRKIISISCSSDWATALGMPTDFILTQADLRAELDDIMSDAANEVLKAPKWWTRLKRWVRRAVHGCSGVQFGTDAQGRCMEWNVRQHWATGGNPIMVFGSSQPAVSGESCNGDGSVIWNAGSPCS